MVLEQQGYFFPRKKDEISYLHWTNYKLWKVHETHKESSCITNKYLGVGTY